MEIPFMIVAFPYLRDAESWTAIAEIPLDKSIRAIRTLDGRCFDLRRSIHEQITEVWKSLVYVDFDESTITINAALPGMSMFLLYCQHLLISKRPTYHSPKYCYWIESIQGAREICKSVMVRLGSNNC